MKGGLLLVIIIILVTIGIIFGAITSVAIANHLGLTGWSWWIVAITIFSALGGAGSSFISIGRRD